MANKEYKYKRITQLQNFNGTKELKWVSEMSLDGWKLFSLFVPHCNDKKLKKVYHFRKEKIQKSITAYERLVKDLNSGEIKIRDIDIAYMVHIKQRKDIPEGVKNLLVQREGGGIIRSLFKQISQTVGNMEVAYRRGMAFDKEK